jgi:hypothetical protein
VLLSLADGEKQRHPREVAALPNGRLTRRRSTGSSSGCWRTVDRGPLWATGPPSLRLTPAGRKWLAEAEAARSLMLNPGKLLTSEI